MRYPPAASLLELASERIIDLLVQQADADLKPLITDWDQQGSSFILWHTACAALHFFSPVLLNTPLCLFSAVLQCTDKTKKDFALHK